MTAAQRLQQRSTRQAFGRSSRAVAGVRANAARRMCAATKSQLRRFPDPILPASPLQKIGFCRAPVSRCQIRNSTVHEYRAIAGRLMRIHDLRASTPMLRFRPISIEISTALRITPHRQL
jgi:hypothetical protein